MSLLKTRQSTMTYVSSAVNVTAFDPAIAACSAYRSTQVSAASAVDLSSVTSSQSSLVVL